LPFQQKNFFFQKMIFCQKDACILEEN
jgi:hypothetical protein